jgi:hypothetical protein
MRAFKPKALDCGSLLPLSSASLLAGVRVGSLKDMALGTFVRAAAGCVAQSGSRLPQSMELRSFTIFPSCS